MKNPVDKLLVLILWLTLTGTMAMAQPVRKVVVEVENIASEEGRIMIALFNSRKDFLENPYMSQSAPAAKGTMTFTFENVPPGEYTVSVYHDLNENGELDTNFMGIPDEPYGISMEGRSDFGPPSYRKAVFTVADKHVKLIITLE